MNINKVSVVITARNEEATIGKVLDELNTAIARCPASSSRPWSSWTIRRI